MRIGLLALQGDFAMHHEMFRSLGAETAEVRTETELNSVDALVIPGGESSTMTKLLSNELREELQRFGKSHAVWGTCAGMIMISQSPSDARVKPLGWMSFTVSRNGFGRQVHSFEADLDLAERIEDSYLFFHGVFIRAPRILEISNDVTPLAWLEDEVVCVQQGNWMASSFHPELTDDPRLHRYFLSLVSARP